MKEKIEKLLKVDEMIVQASISFEFYHRIVSNFFDMKREMSKVFFQFAYKNFRR